MTHVVYVGYPCDSRDVPAWVEEMISHSKDSAAFYLSGGQIVPQTLSAIATRTVSPSRVERLSTLASGRYSARLIPTLLEGRGDKISAYAMQNPVNIEGLILQDLWVLLRSDYFVVDLDSVGRGRVGMELAYASTLGLKIIGVSQCAVADPWMTYHVDRICKPGRIAEEIQ
jgi:hypothetical protein